MKTMRKTNIWMSAIIALTLQAQVTNAQKIDEERMKRDIEVAENVLATLIKQQLNSKRTFFGLEIKGTYQEGYGVTFRLPDDHTMPMFISTGDAIGNSYFYSYSDESAPVVVYSNGVDEETDIKERKEKDKHIKKERTTVTLRENAREKRKIKMDSVRDEYNEKIIQAAKDFIVDYGDLISQLSAKEKIIVTNQDQHRSWYFRDKKRTHISIEGNKADITAYKQGKLNREQAIAKLKVVNTEFVEVKEPDLELLSSIFSRLYKPDLSKTYFLSNNLHYERLKDYGVIYYMQVYSSNIIEGEGEARRHSMPTLGMEDVDQETRDKKIAELYPQFERELKENILEYGRTLKTLKDDEMLVFNVTLTKCEGCGIPSTLELAIKGEVLKAYGAGKFDKSAGVGKFSVKKGPKQ